MKSSALPTAARLGQQPFLHGMQWQHLEALAAVAASARFGPDEVIFHEGEAANRFYLILTGSVGVETRAGDREIRLQSVEAGEALGWSWLFAPFSWRFTARTITAVEAYFFHAPTLRQRMDDDPALGYAVTTRMVAVLSERLQATRHRLSVVEAAAAGRSIPCTLLAGGGGAV